MSVADGTGADRPEQALAPLDRDLLDAFVPEFEAEAVRLAMVRDAAAAARALDQLRGMAATLGAASLSTMAEQAAAALDPLDLPALHAAAEALARQARAIGAAGTDLPLPAAPAAAAAPDSVPAAPPATALDREILEAFAPEFGTACGRLASAADSAAAMRALDGLRALAGAAGLASLRALLDRAPPPEPFDAQALRALATALRAQAARIVEAGQDLAPPEPEAIAVAEPTAHALDPELLTAFAPEFDAGCDRLAEAVDATGAGRAVQALDGMAVTLGLQSLRALLAEVPLDPFDATVLRDLAARLRQQAEAIIAAGRDVPVTAATKALAAATAPRRRVLVVDDSAMMRRLVRETLATDPDFEVIGEAPDGRAALEAMATLKPDLVMLDIEMPELDGIGVLRRWALTGGGAIVIVSSAARPGSATAIEARRLGAAGIIGKPSGAISPDLRQRQGEALLRVARRATGLPMGGLA